MRTHHSKHAHLAVIAIGRNEGARLLACLDSLRAGTRAPDRVIYVDSGSTDGSAAAAQDRGAEVVDLDLSVPFTAARARNAGLAALKTETPPEFVQFIDGDCALDPNWLDTALTFLQATPDAAVVCGRRRERFPEQSVYNRLCDQEWDTPIGQARACGGDALMRWSALDAVDGYNPSLIAGEEPEMCVRLRQKGWQVWRIDAEMTLHDAAMTRFGQFWKRTRRGGWAFAEGAAMHGAPPERHGVRGRNSAVLWGAALPLGILLGTVVLTPAMLLAFAIYPAQILRLARSGGGDQAAWERAVFLVLGKPAEARGVLDYTISRMRGRRGELIEYK